MSQFGKQAYLAFEKQFEEKRKGLNNEIQKYILMLKNINELSDLQVNALSMRQRLLEDSHYLMIMHNAFMGKQREIKNSLFAEINNNLQTRARNLTEKNIMIEGNERYIDIKSIIDLFDNQISFYTDSIKTVDHILYGIKSRMSLEELLGI